MNQRKHLTLVAAASALLASLPLSSVFDHWTWLMYSFVVVAAMCGVAVVVRSMRAPSWAPTAAMLAAGLLIMTWLFRSGHEIAGIIPGPDTFRHFRDLLTTAATEMSEFSAPVDDRAGFLFLTTLGVAGVAIVVDLFAVVLRRPALAGLPMLAIYSVPVAVAEDSVSMIPFLLGAAGFLWLLVTDNVDRVRRFGRRFTGDGRDVDLWEPSPLAAAGQRLGLIGLALAVVLPLAVPGMSSGLLERFGSGSGSGLTGGSGNGRSVNLTALLSGELNRSHPINMVRVVNDPNDPKPFYLRFATADDLRSDGFFNRPPTSGAPIGNGIAPPSYPGVVTTAQYKASVEILDLENAQLPVYSSPTKVTGLNNSWLYDSRSSTIYSGREKTNKKKYSFEYVRPELTPEELRSADPLPTDDRFQQQYTSVPSVNYVKDLVSQLTAGKSTEYDKVLAIFNYFSTANHFVYDLTTGSDTSGSKIVDFLKNKRGFCVQYAAAMGWMLRQAKIPSRVAFGFTQGGLKQGNAVVLTNYNLHAWTEVYFQGFGWVPFDPTPGTAITGSVSPQWAPNPSQPQLDGPNGDNDKLHPGQAPSVDPSSAAAAGGPAGNDPQAGSGAGGTGTDLRPVAIGGSIVGGILLLLLLLAMPMLTRRRMRTRRLKFRAVAPPTLTSAPGSATAEEADPLVSVPPGLPVVLPPDDAVYQTARANANQAWDELLDTMTDYHVQVDDAETPRATGARLVERERLRDAAADGVRLLSSAEEQARYALRPLTGQELRSSLAAVRTALAERASRGTRIMAVLLPPSVVQRWRAAVSGRATDMTNGVGRRRDNLVRTLSVRRMVTRRAKT